MFSALKWLGLALGGLVIAAVLVYTASRLWPIPKEEAQALAMLDAPHTLPGSNGFAALWAIRHDLSADELERAVADEKRRLEAKPAWNGTGSFPEEPSALDRYPLLDADTPIDAPFCRLHEDGCLKKVRASLATYTALIAARAPLSARIAMLDDYDHFRSPFPARFDTPIPAYQPLTRDLTTHAYAFVQGDTDAALTGVCRSASIARKLVASGDTLIGSIIGVALMKGASALFIDMLIQLPDDYSVPDQCRQVFQADGTMEAGICHTMMGEGRYLTGSIRALMPEELGQVWYAGLFLDPRKTAARSAPRFIWFCGAQAKKCSPAIRPFLIPPSRRRCGRSSASRTP